jgi:hypothetical protein
MPTFITKLAPQAILLAVAIYWSWPSLTQSVSNVASSAAKEKKPGASLEFSAATLSPAFPSPPKRDPFEFPGAKHVAKTNKNMPSGKQAAALTAADAKDSGLVLNATCIVGQQRLALINGQVYREKEVIKGKESGDDPVNWLVTDILPHKVLLLHQGVPLQLGYSNGAPKPAETRGPDKRPQKAAK